VFTRGQFIVICTATLDSASRDARDAPCIFTLLLFKTQSRNG